MTRIRTGAGALALLLAIVLGAAELISAQTITPPIPIANSGARNTTLGIPRWKAYQSPSNPNNLWLGYASSATSASSMTYSTDGGSSWSTSTIQIEANGYMDFHLSLFGYGGELYFTFPGVGFRKFDAPAQSESDRGPLVEFPGTSGAHRSNVMVDGNGRIWVFTREGDVPSENVRYQYSDNDGATWTSGLAYATGTNNVRIGSMPFLSDGRACLVVLHLESSKGYEYYLWNGSSFEARPDHSIYGVNMGYERAFTHNVVNDTVMHLVFGDNDQLHHLWKNYNNGTGSWSYEVIDTSPNTDGMEWYPHSTVHGDDLYVFYAKKSTSATTSSMIYYKKWSQSSQSWTSPQLVSAGLNGETNVCANTTFHVPDNATFIPVFWTTGTDPYTVYFSRILIGGSGEVDTTAPGWIDDLDATTGSAQGQIDLNWTAPGDDDQTGWADHYDIRYDTDLLTEQTWSGAMQVQAEPSPAAAGSNQSMTISGLIPGTMYYVGMKVYDEAGNDPGLSVVDSAEARTDFGSGTGEILPVDFTLYQNYPNPFNPSTVIAYYLPRACHVSLTVYNIMGQQVRQLVDGIQSSGEHSVVWDGVDDDGFRVSSGVYFSSLEADRTESRCKMVLLK
ncbi:T9SS type A sorting domain-containing protein [bacterium]|nr:T9SS type A sorting domain-containing protein [bacterium]